MRKSLTILLFFSTVLLGQFNHEDKLVIKRNIGKSTLTFGFDGRINGTGFFHKHLDVGVHFPFKSTWTIGLKYSAQTNDAFKDHAIHQ